MEHRRIEMVVGCVVALGILLTPMRALPNGEGHGESSHASAPNPVEARTVGELWRGVKFHEAELNQLVQTKELGKVHEFAFAIRDLVAAMPERSGQLSAEQQVKLKGNVKYVATLAERLDAAGDAKSQSATESSFKQLQAVLRTIEELYPSDALK